MTSRALLGMYEYGLPQVDWKSGGICSCAMSTAKVQALGFYWSNDERDLRFVAVQASDLEAPIFTQAELCNAKRNAAQYRSGWTACQAVKAATVPTGRSR